MNISRINCNEPKPNTFRGCVTVKNLKTNTVQKYLTSEKADMQLYDKFISVANNRMFDFHPKAEQHLARLKGCINLYSDVLKDRTLMALELPDAKNYAAAYSHKNGESIINAPGLFEIKHSFKQPQE